MFIVYCVSLTLILQQNAPRRLTQNKLQLYITTKRGTITVPSVLPIFAEPVIVVRTEPLAAAHRVMFYTVLKCERVQVFFNKSPFIFLFFGQRMFAHHVGFDRQLLCHTPLQCTYNNM